MADNDDIQPGGTDGSTIDPLIGMLVDQRYRITRRLARGGMATVYIADDERLDRPVALKVMHPHLADSADFVTRFRREARSAARIVHPGVVSVFDQGIVAGQGFLVMELIEGTNLRTKLRQEGAFAVGDALAITQEVLHALGAAHRVGVIHRDIKPENVLVPTVGGVRVTDFGLARAASEVSQSSTGSMLGTVAYVAPEMVTQGEVDERTDIYAVGVMLFELLTGSVPWHGEAPIQIAMHHAKDEIPSPSQQEPWLPTEVDELVAALSARDPASRPPNAVEAADLVARTAAALPQEITQRKAHITPTVAEKSSTEVIQPVSVTTDLPATVRASSQQVIHTTSAPQAEQAPQRAKKGRRVAAVLALISTLLVLGGVSSWWWWTEYGPGAYLDMPQVAGQSADDAQSLLQSMGLGVLRDEEFSDDVQSGLVIDSDPVAGASVHKDGEVRLRVSKGVDMREVPKLVGGTEEAARVALMAAGLAVGDITREWSDEAAEGIVIAQGVAEGELLKHDSKVTFVVSKGREPVTVPNVVGQSAEAARSALENLGLVVSTSEAYSDEVDEGQVISQDKPEGTSLFRGDPVSFVVSKGPELVTVPDVFGLQESNAVSTLENAGLNVQVNRVLGGVFGTVRSSDPEAGARVRKGSTVTITVV